MQRERWKKFRPAALDFPENEASYHPAILGSGEESNEGRGGDMATRPALPIFQA